MTKIHFEDLAERCKDSIFEILNEEMTPKKLKDASCYPSQIMNIYERIVEEMVEFCEDQNPKFDQDKFRKACGL